MPGARSRPHDSPVALRDSDWKALGRQLLLLTALVLAAHLLAGPVVDLVIASRAL
jgi:hypothetical protein